MLNKTPQTLLFYYPVSYLWDKVQQHSGMIAKVQPESERYYVSGDDNLFFLREISKSISIAYELCHKLSTGLTIGIILNKLININSVDPVNSDTVPGDPNQVTVYGFYLKNLLGHKDHALNIIDSYIETFLIDHFLKAWWLKCGLPDLYKVSIEDVNMHIAMLNNSMYALYKPSVTPDPSWSSEQVSVDLETGIEIGQPIVVINEIVNVLPEGEFEQNYNDTDTIVVIHNLNKESPYVEATDSDGHTFEPLWTPIDENSGVASWNTVGSGILRFNANGE